MLVLSRKKNESINIAEDIKITILDISGDTIKLGIEAPRNIQVYRSEVYLAIQKENQQAAAAKTTLNELVKFIGTDTNAK